MPSLDGALVPGERDISVVKKKTGKVVEHDTISKETHMQVFARLASVKNMHGHPGPRKPKKG